MLGPKELELVKKVVDSYPREVGLAMGRWTAPLVAPYIEKVFGKKVGQRQMASG